MKKWCNTLIIILSICLGITFQANAALIEADYQSGDNNAVFDTVTGLTWLDLTLTVGLSYEDAEAFDNDYRYATNLEVEQLFSPFDGANFLSIGIAPTVSEPYASLAHEFAQLFGTNLGLYSYGLYEDENNELKDAGVYLNSPTPNVYGTDLVFSSEAYRTTGNIIRGTFLVKKPSQSTMNIGGAGAAQPVVLSEPSVWLVTMFSILVLANTRARRKNV